jgi:thiol peroxidase
LLSDYRERAFGPAYGVLIPEIMLDARAVFVLDKDNTLRYVEYVKEVSEHPNYEAALAAAKKLTA